MACYIYSCRCGNTFEKNCSVSEWKSKRKCPECGKLAHQNLMAEHGSGNVDSQMKDYHFYGDDGCRCYAASYMKGQEKEMKERHPGREFRWHNSCWIPIIKNRTDFKKFLNERNYIEKN